MQRKFGVLLIVFAAVPIAAFAATAWACGTLVTANASPRAVAATETVTVSGRNYAATGHTPVQIRWNSRTGAVLKEVTAAEMLQGTQVSVPASARPGWYMIVATQYRLDNGLAKTGSPGRTTVRVQGTPASQGSEAAPFGAANPTGSGGTGSPDVPLPGILLSAALLATGLTLVARGKGATKATRPTPGA